LRLPESLIAACAGWLVAACHDAEPAKAPPLAPELPRAAGTLRQPRSSLASHASLSKTASQNQTSDPGSRAKLTPASGSGPSETPLTDRFARARALATLNGSASYYADALAGRKTASGALYEPQRFSAAHRSLPFGSVLRVTRADGGQVVYVRVTDRGPFGSRGRILDLSRAAAEKLGMLRVGVVKVRVEVLEYGPPRKPRRRRR